MELSNGSDGNLASNGSIRDILPFLARLHAEAVSTPAPRQRQDSAKTGPRARLSGRGQFAHSQSCRNHGVLEAAIRVRSERDSASPHASERALACGNGCSPLGGTPYARCRRVGPEPLARQCCPHQAQQRDGASVGFEKAAPDPEQRRGSHEATPYSCRRRRSCAT